MNDVLIVSILSFWFSDATEPLWFNSTPEFDSQLQQQYEQVWEQAASGDLDDWKNSADGALALVIILDQFPLNMFRNQAKGYSTEAKAREIAQYAIKNNLTENMSKSQKAFLYLPFMHSEDINDQQRAIDLYDQAGLEGNARYARHHYGVIERFGRFPHRNEALGRVSTQEELDYLKTANW
ncbi:MAG: DUF924 domain-containing protein [Gammaproteobacteria bacterium]|nr:DUF924 domain-containing protein [Gammaproteobacteria bacterium]